MILTSAAVVAGLGFVLFIAGSALDRPEVAMFGAIIVVGIGGTGAMDGYQVKTGEVHKTDEANNTTVINNTYEDLSIHTDFPLDIVIILLGAVMLMSSAGEASEAGDGGKR